jgi:putative MATE family efflux protein
LEKKLLTGSPFRALLAFSLPIIGGNLFQLFYTLADTIIVGRTMGADALAAVGATGTLTYFILCFVQGFTSGLGICLGQRYGAGDEAGMRHSIAASRALCLLLSAVLTAVCCLLARPVLRWMQTPPEIFEMAYTYLFVVLLGTGVTIFYNIISNFLRALGDSKTPLYFLVLSSLLNIGLDILFIVPLGWGVAGAAWATVLAQLLSAMLCTLRAVKKFPILRNAFCKSSRKTCLSHFALAFPMGFQMSVMCIGQLAMQIAVNRLGAAAIAGYTAATRVDQISVLVNGAFGIAISNYVAQNFGAGSLARIRLGVRAALIQITTLNLSITALMLLSRNLVVPLFVDSPTPEIIAYANGYLLTVAPFYVILGLLLIFRSSIQSVGNTRAPFFACIVELIMRVSAAVGLSRLLDYTGICLATPLAWIGAVGLLIPVYLHTVRRWHAAQLPHTPKASPH